MPVEAGGRECGRGTPEPKRQWQLNVKGREKVARFGNFVAVAVGEGAAARGLSEVGAQVAVAVIKRQDEIRTGKKKQHGEDRRERNLHAG